MPKRILIIGILFCLGGALAILEVVSDLFRSHVNLNFAVLLLPVGIGILKGKKSSQWWGRFWIILGYIACGLLAGASIIWPENVTANGLGREIRGSEAVPFVLLGAFLFTIIFIVLHKLLYSQTSKAYFEGKSEPTGIVNDEAAPHRD